VVRLRTPDGGATSFHDLLRGEVAVPNAEIRDAVLLKSDGYPTYHLANVVDDHLMGVTHVVRAEEWVVSTPLHVLLYRAFGWTVPTFAHLPLLRNPDANKSKISKRKMDTSVESYRDQGILPEALVNFLATMGWSMPDGREVFSLDEFVAAFELERVSLGGPVFDLKRLRNLNARYLREVLPLEEVAERLAPWLRERGYASSDEDYLLDVVDVLRPRAETLARARRPGPLLLRRTRRLRRRRPPPAGGGAVVPRGPRAGLLAARVLRRRRDRRPAARLRPGPGGADRQGADAAAGRAHRHQPGASVVDLVAIMGRQRTLAGSGTPSRRSSRACPTTTPSGSGRRPRRPPRPPRRPRRKRRPPAAPTRG
jgi:hypothetical protein